MSEGETDNVSRRERRARAKGSPSDEIKDRNQRLRSDAASKRRAERKRELESAAREGLAAGERMDDALTRTAHHTGQFFRNHFGWLQWVVVAGVTGSMAFLVYDYRQGVAREKQGSQLDAALDAVYGRLSTDAPVTPADRSLVDTRSEFPTEEARQAAASEAWKKLAALDKPELKLLARLGEAAVLYDQRKFADARKAYEAVLDDGTLGRFPELKARAQEAVGLTYEAEGRLDDALKAFLTLQDLGSESRDLAVFHEGRVKYSQGKTDEAKQLLEKLLEKLSGKRGATDPPGYLEAATEDLLKTVDPTRAAKAQGISPEQLEALKRQLEEMQRQAAQAPPADATPPAPAADAQPDQSPPGLPQEAPPKQGAAPNQDAAPAAQPAPFEDPLVAPLPADTPKPPAGSGSEPPGSAPQGSDAQGSE